MIKEKHRLASIGLLTLLILSQAQGVTQAQTLSEVVPEVETPSSSLPLEPSTEPSFATLPSTISESQPSVQTSTTETSEPPFEPSKEAPLPEDTVPSTTAQDPQTDTLEKEATAISTYKWGTSDCTFDDTTGVVTIGGGDLGGTYYSPWNNGVVSPTTIKKIVFTGDVVPQADASYLFNSLTNLESFEGMEHLDTSNVTNMSYMFSGSSALRSLDLSYFDTSKVETMEGMFFLCSALRSLDLSRFDTSKVKSMEAFLYYTFLARLTLGENFKFVGGALLDKPVVESGIGTGKWIREDGNSAAYTPEDFMSKYGTGDLKPGTYIGEVESNKAKLDFSMVSSATYAIGNTITSTFTIKHTTASDKDSEAQDIVLKGLNNLTLGGSQDLSGQLALSTYNRYNQKQGSTTYYPIGDSVSLPPLKEGNYYKAVITGDAVNNTNSEAASNFSLTLSYRPSEKANPTEQTFSGKININSGVLMFNRVPEGLPFETTPLHLKLNNTLIKRQDPAWNIEVSDQRGSIPTGKKQTVDRQDWTVLVSATPFKDKQNNSLDGALSTTFVKDKQRQDLSSSELKIESHAVTGETPQTHSTSVIQWNENEGLQTIVHDRSKLNTGRDYTSTLTFELRTGP